MIRILKKYFVQALAFGSIMTFLEFGQNGTELLNYFIYITTAYFVLANLFIVLAVVGGRTIISGRSLDTMNVQVVLEKLGGGGHITIAGAQIRNSSIISAEMRLRAAIDEVLFDAE